MPEEKPKKRLFKITRIRKETALKVAYHKETIEDLLDNAPGAFAWESKPEHNKIIIEEIPIKEDTPGFNPLKFS